MSSRVRPDRAGAAAKGRGVESTVKDNEGHGFHNEENRFDFYRRVEVFLARHLGRRAENPPPV